MLPALVGGHTLHHRVLHSAAGNGLTAPDNEVVQEHGADDPEDKDDVDDAHPACDHRADVFRMDAIGHVNGRKGELLRNALVTLAAGGIEVSAINRRVGIAGRQNIVHAVAA